MPALPIEDDFNDIIGKAQKGLEISSEDLARSCDISPSLVRDARKGQATPDVIASLGKALALNADALLAIAKGSWKPAEAEALDGFEMITTPFSAFTVNAYLVWDPETSQAAAFDTGTDPKPLIESVREKGLTLESLYLTHTHRDHIEGVSELVDAFGCAVVADKREAAIPSGAELIEPGTTRELGSLKIEAVETTGHTAGGLSFVVSGLMRPLAIVGDALFAGSMGGANISYEESLNAVQTLMQLDPGTLLAPGHGPLTSVKEERAMNCFYRK